METNGTAVIRSAGLVKQYFGRRVVNEVSLNCRAGEVVGLLGPNGAGKTTTFYMIVGLIRPNGGKVYLGDAEITGLPMFRRARKGISYLPQEASVFRKLTVEGNIEAILETLPIGRAERKQRKEALLEELGITHLARSMAYSLSGGERRRVEICRALVLEPQFMLLDEPFAGLDPIVVLDIQEIIKKLRDRGIGIIISDHNVRETLGTCDRAYILAEGKLFAEGTPDVLANDEKVRKIYLGEQFRL